MRRIKWHSLGGIKKRDIDRIASEMLGMEYGDESGTGFSLTSTRAGLIEGRYLERRQIKDEVIDPFGQKLEFSRVEFQQVEFRLAAGPCELEIYDCPRSLRDFFNQLSRLSQRTISISPIAVDVLEWCDRISKNGGGAKVTALTATNLVLSTTVSAKIRIQGGDEVRAALKSLTGARKYEVERLVVDWPGNTGLHRAELHRDGKAQIISGDEAEALLLLRATICAITAEPSD